MRSAARALTAVLCVALFLVPVCVLGGEIERRSLPNGVPVVVELRPGSPVVSVGVVVDAGTKRDPAGLEGLSRVTIEALAQGAESIPDSEMAVLRGRGGLDFRHGATRDIAFLGVRAAKPRFEDALRILSALLIEPRFAQDAVLSEIEAARAAVVSDEKKGFERTYSQVLSLLLGDHPYRHSVGTRRGLEALTREAVVDFHRRHYTTGNTVISIVGDVGDGHLDLLSDAFADYPRSPTPPPDVREPERGDYRMFEFRMDAGSGQAQRGFLVPGAGEGDAAALSVIESLLGRLRKGRIHASIGAWDCGSCGAFNHLLVDGGWFVIHAESEDPENALERIESEIERLKTEPVPPDELSVAKWRLKGLAAIESELGLDRGLALGWSELAGIGASYPDEMMEKVEAVDADDVMRVARRHLVGGAAVIMMPGKPRGRGI